MAKEATTPHEKSRVGELASKPDAASTGSGYWASVIGDARPLWSCPHVHFTEHSALACAEEHLRTWRRLPRREAAIASAASMWLERGHVDERALKPGAVASGGGYRAIITDVTRESWSCPHVHFTEHSARACAERHMRI